MSGVKAQFTATPPIGIAPITVEFMNQSIGVQLLYKWFLQNQFESNSKDLTHTYLNTSDVEMSYDVMLIVTDAFGCIDTAQISVIVDPLSELIIPNVFTPNGDGINDLFTLQSKALSFVRAELFNTWGLKLYEWATLHGGWDGRTEAGMEVPQGTYFYIITAKGVDGKEYKLKGPFTLFR